MKNPLTPGTSLKSESTVRESDSARSHGSGRLDVYATPAMIAFMEKVSMECVEPCLEEGQGTVGISIEVRHLKASAIGAAISCSARLSKVEGRLLSFEVELKEKDVLIGKGTHERFIIDEKKFMDKVRVK